MMARLGHEDGSSSSSMAQASSSDGGASVTHLEARTSAAVVPSSGSTKEQVQQPTDQPRVVKVASSTQTSTQELHQARESGNPCSPVSSLDSKGRARTSSMCSSGKESSSGGEQLAQAVKGASLTFTSSSSSSSLCSDEAPGGGDAGSTKKLDTLPEESAPALAAPGESVARQTSQEPPAGCKTGEGLKEVRSSPPVEMSSGTPLNASPPTEPVVHTNPGVAGVASGEARTVAPAAVFATGLEAPTVSNKGVDGTQWKEPRPHSTTKPQSRSSGIPSLKMLARTTPPDVVTHGFVTSSSALVPPPPQQPPAKTAAPLRRGKWTVEEEAYVARVIQDFNSGFLNAPAGTTLRSYLSEKLHCDPMRITKKFTGDACIGKRVFHPAVRCAGNAVAIDKAQAELDALEQRWRRRLEMQQRESAKKAAASAAAAAAAASGRNSNLHVPASQAGMTTTTAGAPTSTAPSGSVMKQNVVARTASWLDRATAVLSSSPGAADVSMLNPPIARSSLPKDSEDHQLEDQMKEVRRLINEGPIIQQTTAGLPNLLHTGGGTPQESGSLVGNLDSTGATGYSMSDMHHGVHQPLDKRPRRSSADNNTTTGAEDAEALVGFLNSVRAAAERTG